MATPVVALIGDVIGSRTTADRVALHAELATQLDRVNARRTPLSGLRITVGDEFQGVFASVGQALAAVIDLRLALLPGIEVRFGVGVGEAVVLADAPRVEDGPAWWAARSAIDGVHQRRLGARSTRRIGYLGPNQELVTAAVVGLDELLVRLDQASVSVLAGMIQGRTQALMAQELGISPSAVSQRIQRDGLGALRTMIEMLEGVRT